MKYWLIYWLQTRTAFALDSGNPGGPSGGIKIENPLGCNEATECIQGILQALFKLSIPVVSIMIIYGGFQIMASGGNEEKLKTGKNTILYAIVGFGVIILANGVAAIIQDVVGQSQ